VKARLLDETKMDFGLIFGMMFGIASAKPIAALTEWN